MDEQEISRLRAFKWMESRIPALDALATFVPQGNEKDPLLEKAISKKGFSRWFPIVGGHRVLIPYEGEPYDSNRFTVQPEAWDHETCRLCRDCIPPMTLCHVTANGPYFIVCAKCYKQHINPDSSFSASRE